MTKLLEWTAFQTSRRGFLTRLTATAFGAFAGLAAGRAEIAWASNCINPYGGQGACSDCNCTIDGHCQTGCDVLCQEQGGLGCPGGGACWQSGISPPHRCCDCACRTGSFGWYCFCHGAA